MTPTLRFRWLEVPRGFDGAVRSFHEGVETFLILQQYHEGIKNGERFEQWQDVPIMFNIPHLPPKF